jgi:rRNA maturation protein Rpf1
MTVLLCTSLRPSPRTRTLCNDLVSATNDFNYYLRGKTSLILLSAYANQVDADKLWIINSRFGDPKLIDCYDTSTIGVKKIGSLLFNRVMLARELKGFKPKSTRGGHLRLIPPEHRALTNLYEMLIKAIGKQVPSDSIFTELRLEASRDHYAEMNFIDNETQTPCGPKIILESFRW